jgi:hypothetical protein
MFDGSPTISLNTADQPNSTFFGLSTTPSFLNTSGAVRNYGDYTGMNTKISATHSGGGYINFSTSTTGIRVASPTYSGTVYALTLYGIRVEDQQLGTNATGITTFYGIKVDETTEIRNVGGSVAYGIHVTAPSGSGANTTNWGIVQAGTGDATRVATNRFEARTLIGAAVAPATSAVLELQSTTGALLVSRMTTAQRDALTAVNGMMVYNSTTGAFEGYAGGSWTGGLQTPWLSDIVADGYDLTDLSNILFRETTGAPAGTDVGLFRDNSGDLNLNVLTGKTFNVQVNGGDEYNFSSSSLDVNSNIIENIGATGTDFSGTGGLTLADDLTVNANASVINSSGLTNDEENLYVNGNTSGNPTFGDTSGILVEFQPVATGGTDNAVTIAALTAQTDSITLSNSGADDASMTWVTGVYARGATDGTVTANSTATITNLAGIRIEDPYLDDADLTVTNPYGLYIDDWGADGATFTNGPYGIYQAGADDLNVLSGETAFGRAHTGNDTSYGVVIQGALCVDDSTANCPAGPTSGAIYVENSVGAGNVSAFDIAEYYPASEPVEKGDVVVAAGATQVVRSSQEYDPALIGVVSTDPAAVIDETSITFGKTAGDKFDPLKPYIALAGRVPVKVSGENGNISPGDPLTSSSTAGVAMKATKSGPIIGKALEAYGGSGVGKIMVFVSTGWYVAPLSEDGEQIADLSDISVSSLTASTIHTDVLFIGDRKLAMSEDGKLVVDGTVNILGDIVVDGDTKIAGDLKVENVLTANKLVVSEISLESSGNATLPAGQTKIFVPAPSLTSKSQVSITATTLTGNNFNVTEKVADQGFTVEVVSPEDKDVNFDWFIVN